MITVNEAEQLNQLDKFGGDHVCPRRVKKLALTDVVTVSIPARVRSLNDQLRDSRRGRASESAKHRKLAHMLCRAPVARFAMALLEGRSLSITMTRVAPGTLDGDNLQGSGLKAIRDGVTDALGLTDDNDPRLVWRYAQRKGEKRPRGVPAEYSVQIEIQVAP